MPKVVGAVTHLSSAAVQQKRDRAAVTGRGCVKGAMVAMAGRLLIVCVSLLATTFPVARAPPPSLSSYIVHLRHTVAPPAVSYRGGIPGLAATAPSAPPHAASAAAFRRPRFDSALPHVAAYAAHLRQLQLRVAQAAGLGPARLFYSYALVANAFAARLTAAEARLLRQNPAVALVRRDGRVAASTSHSPNFTRVASGVWPQAGGQRSAGQGSVVGIIDTGVWPEHPSFSDAHMASTPRPPHWRGTCATTSDFPWSACNNKLIGAQFFAEGLLQAGGRISLRDFKSPRDGYGHGTWCAAAAVGAPNVSVVSGRASYGQASGIAPGAFLAVYKALWRKGGSATGVQSDILAAIERAVADGCDVISLSIGMQEYTSYFDDIALLYAVHAGVFPAAAAGNNGPFNFSVVNAAPFYLTVGASTTDRYYFLRQAQYGAEAPQVTYFSGQGPLVDPSNLTRRALSNDVLKPDILGPGNDLWAAWRGRRPGSRERPQFSRISGTSMAAPQLAGLAAVLLQRHPAWTPAQVKSAILTTAAVQDNRGAAIQWQETEAPATPWQTGSGQMDGLRVLDPGLTYDTTYNDYVRFLAGQDPVSAKAVFGEVKAIRGYELNQPNIAVSLMNGSAVVPRTVTNVGGSDSMYQVAVVAPDGVAVSVQPQQLTIPAGGTASFQVVLNTTIRDRNFRFGSLTWTDNSGHIVQTVLAVQGI